MNDFVLMRYGAECLINHSLDSKEYLVSLIECYIVGSKGNVMVSVCLYRRLIVSLFRLDGVAFMHFDKFLELIKEHGILEDCEFFYYADKVVNFGLER